jgi:hypothetical protein
MKFNAKCAPYAKFVAKGCLTRLALMFNAKPQKKFTGAQVTEILLRVITSIEHGTDDVEYVGPQAAELESSNGAD